MDTEQIFAMDRDKKYFLALVVVLLVIIGILVTLLVTSCGFKTFILNLQGDEHIMIDKEDMKTCCTYNDSGETRSCSIFSRYDCNLCNARCET